MRFDVMTRTYNTYGGQSTLSLIPDFLLGDRNFGSAVSELTVTFHSPHTGPPRRTLEQIYAAFHANRKTLPKIVFRRKRGQVAIDIASDLLDGNNRDLHRTVSLPLFNAGVREMITALELLSKRLTDNDDFKLEELLTHCREAQSRLPSTLDELTAFADESQKGKAARDAAMSPWETLEIDWRDFHPKSRGILDDPFYWDCTDDFSPNGNDTGADLLEDYRKWLRRNPTGDPVAFLRQLTRQCGYPPEPLREIDRDVMDAAAVGLAFAELKLRAECRPAVAALARAAIQRQRQQAIDAVDWPHRESRLKSLAMLEAKLPNGG